MDETSWEQVRRGDIILVRGLHAKRLLFIRAQRKIPQKRRQKRKEMWRATRKNNYKKKVRIFKVVDVDPQRLQPTAKNVEALFPTDKKVTRFKSTKELKLYMLMKEI